MSTLAISCAQCGERALEAGELDLAQCGACGHIQEVSTEANYQALKRQVLGAHTDARLEDAEPPPEERLPEVMQMRRELESAQRQRRTQVTKDGATEAQGAILVVLATVLLLGAAIFVLLAV